MEILYISLFHNIVEIEVTEEINLTKEDTEQLQKIKKERRDHTIPLVFHALIMLSLAEKPYKA